MRDVELTSLPIYFIGIWDAVEALGLPSEAKAITRVFNSYHQTRLPPNVTHAAHALSLHELRRNSDPICGKTNSHIKHSCNAGFPTTTAI